MMLGRPGRGRPFLVKIVTAAFLALSILTLALWLLVDRRSLAAGTGRAFFSVDDGKTFFKADAFNIPPFELDGKTAVQALVFTADGGKTRFVGYLMRYTPRGVELVRAMHKRAHAGGPPVVDPELSANCEIKKPGSTVWTRMSDVAASAAVMNVVADDNPSATVESVDP